MKFSNVVRESQEKYKAYVNDMLKKHGFDNFAQAARDKDFMNKLDAGWSAKNEAEFKVGNVPDNLPEAEFKVGHVPMTLPESLRTGVGKRPDHGMVNGAVEVHKMEPLKEYPDMIHFKVTEGPSERHYITSSNGDMKLIKSTENGYTVVKGEVSKVDRRAAVKKLKLNATDID